MISSGSGSLSWAIQAHGHPGSFGTGRANKRQLLAVTVDMAGFRYPFQVDRKDIDG
jgi:hypothetical protein